jgi:hypothetical protein
VTRGETDATEEVAEGVVGAATDAEVEARVIMATRVGGVAGVIGRAVRPPEGAVRPSASATRAVRLPGGPTGGRGRRGGWSDHQPL